MTKVPPRHKRTGRKVIRHARKGFYALLYRIRKDFIFWLIGPTGGTEDDDN